MDASPVLDFNAARPQNERRRGTAIDADVIRAKVTSRARAFIEWLLPCAVVHQSGRYAVVGDVQGTPGESLHIDLAGPKAGHWHDFARPEQSGKDLIGLYLAAMGYDRQRDFGRALQEITTEFLGEAPAPNAPRPVTRQIRERAEAHAGKPWPRIDDRPPPCETYVYQDRDGNVLALVRRHEYDEVDPATGKRRKTFSVWCARTGKPQAPNPRPLYRIPAIGSAEHVVFVEGERKADALAAHSIAATCIMFGSGAPLDKVDWSPIAGKIVTVWPDNDPSGMVFADKIIPILQAHGCRVGRMQIPPDTPPKWDAADCIADGKDPTTFINAAIPVEACEQPGRPRPGAADQADAHEARTPTRLGDGVITQDRLARVFAASFADRLRYCHHNGSWFEWTGTPWRRDETDRAFQFARELGREAGASLASPNELKEVGKVAFAAGVERFAQGTAPLRSRWRLGTVILTCSGRRAARSTSGPGCWAPPIRITGSPSSPPSRPPTRRIAQGGLPSSTSPRAGTSN